MSGTAFGTIVLHVAPESAENGPLAIVQDGDMISLDVEKRLLQLELDDAEIQRRIAALETPAKRLNIGRQIAGSGVPLLGIGSGTKMQLRRDSVLLPIDGSKSSLNAAK